MKFILAFTLLAVDCVSALGPAAVNLRTAGNYAILAKTGISTVPKSVITGNIAVSPAAGSFLTGFSSTPPTTFSTSTQVNGQLFAADYKSPTPSVLTQAVLDLGTAIVDANGRTNGTGLILNLAAGNIDARILTPGLYKWTSGVNIPTLVVFSGTARDTWILQVAGTLNLGSASQTLLIGGAVAKNIVWVVGGEISIGAGSRVSGILLGSTAATLKTGATLNGRILVQTAVALQKATVTQPK
ncbi:antifreeze-related protein [Exidia glandulosa HHB12029]|uniref:Antifreeze-related protein n=1 Tax=Exidia glandulosa HHB12029 TaxID=1314781 RepID=A0A166N4N8_EXIGL|nr:antifreeze-related protein [Exidia glandulosa HHB12029]